jgi:molybdopterin-guanine dinucleotide biosynthesis protein A
MKCLPVYLLAGGRSSRFGSDKARAEIAGVPLITRLARWLEPLAAPLVVVADGRDKYQDLGLSTIADLLPGMGPLGGLHAALSHAQGLDWTLVVSCDLLELRMEWLEELGRHATGQTRAVVFRDRFWQPFPGLYHPRLLSEIERNIQAGDWAVNRLLERTRALGLALPPDWPPLIQANTRGQLAAYASGGRRS